MVASSGEFKKTDGETFSGADANMAYYDGALSSSVNTAAVLVGTSSTLLLATNTDRKSALLKNNSSEEMYIGVSGVTIATGKNLSPGKCLYIRNKDGIYGVCTATGEDLRYMEVV